MPQLRKRYLDLLRPYLVGEGPKEDGEWDMFCPLHEDHNPSASLNVEKATWYCHTEGKGGRVYQLIAYQDDWVDPAVAATNGHSSHSKSSGQPAEDVTEAKVQGWTSALLSNSAALADFRERRGLDVDTITRFDLGWDATRKAYTIPIRSETGEFWNVRRYQLAPKDGRRKMWSIKGMGSPRLYPLSIFDGDPKRIIVCEGELDALLTIQNGYPAITRTGAAKVWKSEWSPLFEGRAVYLAHDCDKAGQQGNQIVGRALRGIAASIRIIDLPYPILPKHGSDLTDFWTEYNDVDDFEALLADARPFDPDAPEAEDLEPADVSILDSFDSHRVGRPLRMVTTIRGKRAPGWSIPRSVSLECTQDAGPQCQFCPLNARNGSDTFEVPPSSPSVLEFLDAPKTQIPRIIGGAYGVPGAKCVKLTIEVEDHQAVETLYGRPSVEANVINSNLNAQGEFTNVKITSVGRHDTPTNNTVQVIGALYPDPKRQTNEFLAWTVNRLETSIDNFEASERDIAAMKKFRVKGNQRPLTKLREIADDLAAHVTRIYGRPHMHALMDLVFHSAISFDFAGQVVDRGWIDALVVGDTRTGKSEAAKRMSAFYEAAELISCESASFAGIVGGLQQYGGREWSITWGAIPLNDRRMVILDEVGGLHSEDIAQLSSVRSSGIAELTKIQQEKTRARTRLLWLGNPRNTTMSDYTYGVDAIRPLIGNAEDIARFDIAMAVNLHEVAASEINRAHDPGPQRYTQAASATLIRWIWSRKHEQVVWASGSQDAVYDAANEIGTRYVESPPLIQAANIRIKIARLAVALAGRVFSTTDDCQSILVCPEHVHDAVAFIDRIYNMESFGYAERSREAIADEKEAREKRDTIRKYLRTRKGLAKFLRNQSSFRRADLEETLNESREGANAIINTLWEARMVRRDKGDIKVEPTLHQLLREKGRKR